MVQIFVSFVIDFFLSVWPFFGTFYQFTDNREMRKSEKKIYTDKDKLILFSKILLIKFKLIRLPETKNHW